jgi:hypothetical protein
VGAIAAFYHDCDPDVARDAASRLRPQSHAALGGVVRAAAWRTTASTYLLCSGDRVLTPALQRSSAARVGTTVEIAASHSPFSVTSRPGRRSASQLAQGADVRGAQRPPSDSRSRCRVVRGQDTYAGFVSHAVFSDCRRTKLRG